VILLAAVPLIGCDKDGSGESEPEGEAPAPEPVEAILEIEAGGVTPAVTVTTQMPGNWHADDFFDATWLPEGVNSPMETGLRAEAGCGGTCDATAIASNIEGEMDVARLTERWSQGSSEPHFQPTIEVVDSGDLPNGRFLAYRITYPEPPAGATSIPNESFHLNCYLHNEGDPFYVVLDGTARLENEAAIWPTLRASCESASYTVAAE